MKKTGISVLVLGAMLLCVPKALAQAPKPRAVSRASKIQPPKEKPFEGEWRECSKDMQGKIVCTSYFFLQQGRQICGTWQVDAGKLRSGFLQARDEQSLDETASKNARAVAAITFACSAQKYIGGGLIPKECGSDFENPAWERMGAGWELRTAVCKQRKRAIASYVIPEYGYESICPTASPYERNEYYVLAKRKRKELQQLPWMQQCLNGQEPANVVPSD